MNVWNALKKSEQQFVKLLYRLQNISSILLSLSVYFIVEVHQNWYVKRLNYIP